MSELINTHTFRKVVSTSSVKILSVLLELSVENKPATSTEIILRSDLNPNTFKNSIGVLISLDLVRKNGKIYKITKRGERILSILNKLLDILNDNSQQN